MKYLSPSILSADFTDMHRAVNSIKEKGADWIHCDVMDGMFVPNITFGQKMVTDINKITELPLDVHLMIEEPLRYIDEFSKAGAKIITFHYEATSKIDETIVAIKNQGIKCGIAIKPNTDASVLDKYLDAVDMVLIMSVEPGFSGQKFMPIAIDKIRYIKNKRKDLLVQVDGGINENTYTLVLDAGVDSIVMGNAFFKNDNVSLLINKIRTEY